MRKRISVYFWLLITCLLAMWASGLAVGFSLGIARADVCTGWSGRYFNYSNCGGQVCQGVNFGPFYTSSCSDPYYPPPPPAPMP